MVLLARRSSVRPALRPHCGLIHPRSVQIPSRPISLHNKRDSDFSKSLSWLIPPRLIQYEKTKAGFSLIVGGGKTCQEQHGLHFVQAHGLHIFSWVIDQTVAPLHAINEQIPKSAQMPLFTSRKHFEQKSLVKHNF